MRKFCLYLSAVIKWDIRCDLRMFYRGKQMRLILLSSVLLSTFSFIGCGSAATTTADTSDANLAAVQCTEVSSPSDGFCSVPDPGMGGAVEPYRLRR